MTNKGWFGWLRRNFIAGLLVLAPLALTIWILWLLFEKLDAILKPWLMKIMPFYVPGAGLIVLLLLVLVTGVVAKNYLGRKIFGFWQKLSHKIPIFNKIYPSIKQIGEAVLSDESQRDMFRDAVLIEYPQPDSWVIGFITQDTRGLMQRELPEDCYSIFLPTTPNPTSGFLLFIPKRKVKRIPLSVADAMRVIIAAGSISPEESEDVSERLE
jgi:uncharacterized membrane protein